jgi:hypothetical protein
MARLQLDDLANIAKDAAYVSVGLGVIAFQRLQVRRNELTKTFNEQVGDRMKVVEERLGAVLPRNQR